jgi:hypothetical protein
MTPLEILSLLVIAAGAAVTRRWLARSEHLRLTIFRPYRGDPWPIGVQEDDDVRFDWSTGPRETPVRVSTLERPRFAGVRTGTRR